MIHEYLETDVISEHRCRTILKAHWLRNWWWWCHTTLSEEWGHRGTLRWPSSWATPQGLDQRPKKEEVVPKMARRRGSDAENPEGGELDPAEDIRRLGNSQFT